MIVNIFRVLALLTAAMLTACTHVPYHSGTSVGVRGHYDSTYDDFYFYPDESVYFSIRSGHYYHRPHHRWTRVDTLPRHVYLNPRHRVKLRLHREFPYRHHRDHSARFRFDRSRTYHRSHRQDRRHDSGDRRHREQRDRRWDHRTTNRSRRDASKQPHQRAIFISPHRRDTDRVQRDRRQTHNRRTERNERASQRRDRDTPGRRSTGRGNRHNEQARGQRSGADSEGARRFIDRGRNRERYRTDDRMRFSTRRVKRRDRDRNVVHRRKRQDTNANARRTLRNPPRLDKNQRDRGRAQRSRNRSFFSRTD